jgi:hypothetical protein
MKSISLGCAAMVAVLLLGPRAMSAPAPASPASVAEFLKGLLIPPSQDGGAWEGLAKTPAVRWAGDGPTMTDKPSPDGNYFVRTGMGGAAGRPLQVLATGARSMIFSYYIRDAAPPDQEALGADLRQAGFTVTTARCPRDPRAVSSRRWYRLALPKRKPAFLYAGPTQSGGSGYTLYLVDLPQPTPAEAAAFTDKCQ